jgi:DNA-binding response OmpR family regulator
MAKVLIIDDDIGILDAIKAILEYSGHQVEVLDKPNEIVKQTYDYFPDLILLDLLLSGKDGRQVAKQIKGNDKTKHIPIIMLSAHPSASAAAKEAGADGFLAKPFDMNELIALVEKHTSRNS